MNKIILKVDYFDNKKQTTNIGYISKVRKYKNLETNLNDYNFGVSVDEKKAHSFPNLEEAKEVKRFLERDGDFLNLSIKKIDILEVYKR